ncbi:MAG: hypothetical protein JSR20_06135 [Nitrospira sp.]|nr:hypothetical protein [Nitrospira sp.]
MATNTRNTVQTVTAAKRPTRATHASNASLLSDPSQNADQDERLRQAEYLLGKEAGYREGIAEGERRERERLSPEERFQEQWDRMMKREMNPLVIAAQDRVLAAMIYAIGGLAVIGVVVIFWRVFL